MVVNALAADADTPSAGDGDSRWQLTDARAENFLTIADQQI
jgi:hypothetical protein